MVSKKFLNKKSIKLKRIGESLIPELAQTAAKKPSQFSEKFSPIFLESGNGAIVKDLEGNQLLDTIMAIGPLILGYNHPSTNKAIINQLKKGIIFSLINSLEINLAVKLKKIIPNMDMFRFSKTGADSTSAAIRAARNFTQKNSIISCGYHGWHDWNAIALNNNSGVPSFNKKLINKVQYNNFEQIIDSIDNDTAAIIMEPIIFEFPEKNYLSKIRKITKQKKILLIFDEMWTGFRLHLGGAQKYFKVDADLACYSKAVANGMPLSILAGKRKIINSLNEKSFFYTTFGGETLSLGAAINTIDYIKKNNVCKKIQINGFNLQKKLIQILKNNNINFINIKGYGARCIFLISHEKSQIIKTFIHQEMLNNGILWNGIINLSYSHKMNDVNKIATVFDKICKKINFYGINKLKENIQGKIIKNLLI